MLAGYESRDEVVARALRSELEADDLIDPVRDTLSCPSWLIAHERLEVRIAQQPSW